MSYGARRHEEMNFIENRDHASRLVQREKSPVSLCSISKSLKFSLFILSLASSRRFHIFFHLMSVECRPSHGILIVRLEWFNVILALNFDTVSFFSSSAPRLFAYKTRNSLLIHFFSFSSHQYYAISPRIYLLCFRFFFSSLFATYS